MKYQFRPKLIPTLATLALLPLLVHLGMWQYGKAQQKLALQRASDAEAKLPPLELGSLIAANMQDLQYRPVKAKGRYEPNYQILLDNQVYRETAGYHVITPLHLAGSEVRVLVDRGWISLGRDRSLLPQIDTPADMVEVSGTVWVPSTKFFTLGQPESMNGGWQTVWENLDMVRYRAAVPFEVQPFVVRLDPANAAGGYVREWPHPSARVETNLGYAYQWFGMAVALVAFYAVANLKKTD